MPCSHRTTLLTPTLAPLPLTILLLSFGHRVPPLPSSPGLLCPRPYIITLQNPALCSGIIRALISDACRRPGSAAAAIQRPWRFRGAGQCRFQDEDSRPRGADVSDSSSEKHGGGNRRVRDRWGELIIWKRPCSRSWPSSTPNNEEAGRTAGRQQYARRVIKYFCSRQ